MKKQTKHRYEFKRMKVLVRPIPPDDYSSRLEARIAWQGGKSFMLITSEGDAKRVDRKWAEDPHNKISEVTIQFDGQKQAIVARIPPPSAEQMEQVIARSAS